MENEKNKGKANHDFSLQTELKELEQKRSSLVEELRLAAIDGDFSENFDWTVTRQKIQRIKELEKETWFLKQKMIAANQTSLSSKIIVYQLLSTKQNKTVWLTTLLPRENKDESSPLKKVSFTSPLGMALTNKKVGETSEVKTKKGSYWIKIVNINQYSL